MKWSGVFLCRVLLNSDEWTILGEITCMISVKADFQQRNKIASWEISYSYMYFDAAINIDIVIDS